MPGTTRRTLLLCALVAGTVTCHAELPAFPGAEGFGANTPGGRGGQVCIVTTLEDYLPGREDAIPGSLRAAVETKGPRIIVFAVAGLIPLKAGLTISEPYLTLAGQSAPGAGVCLANYACVVNDTHDVVIRYLRCRPGDVAGKEHDALSVSGSHDVILDHCSASWGTDETLSVSGAGQDNITVQWCFITESLNKSVHEKGAHGYGTLLRTDGHVTFHHNLYAHHWTRCPRPGTYGEEPGLLLDFRNNLIYNWGGTAGYSAEDPVRMNYIGNYLRPGPSSKDRKHAFSVGGVKTLIYPADNVVEGVPAADQWELFNEAKPVNRAAKPFPVAPVHTDPAGALVDLVLADAGASLPQRDAVDKRIVSEVRAGGGRIIDSQQEVGAWPAYPLAEAPADRDKDGMPDAWEESHALDPDNPTDAAGDADGDGYTNIEEFLNATSPAAS